MNEEMTCGDYQYILLEDGTAEITRHYGKAAVLAVPSVLDGHVVTTIGNDAFSGLMNSLKLTSITLPDSVRVLIGNPFSYCKKLETVKVSIDHPYLATIDGVLFSKADEQLIWYPLTKKTDSYTVPGGIKIIADMAFFRRDNVESITLPDGVTSIGNKAFFNCRSLKNITLPDSVTSIGDEAFSWSSSLTSIALPDSVTNIGNMVFCNCRSLTSVTLSDRLTSIGELAFFWCDRLTSITLPDSVEILTGNPFAYCEKLETVQVSADHPYLETIDGVLFSKADKRLVWYPVTKTESSYTVPKGIKIIGGSAFSICRSLTSITIPDSVTNIGEAAFSSCINLTSITLPDGVTSIGEGTFYNCSRLISISLPDNLTSIGNGAFARCKNLISIMLPDSVTSIGEGAFDGVPGPITVTRDSYAEQYCKDNALNYIYAD